MPIILNMSEEDYNTMMRSAGSLDNMEERLTAMEPMKSYQYVETLDNVEEYKTQLQTAIAERDEIRQKYIDRFFGGVPTDAAPQAGTTEQEPAPGPDMPAAVPEADVVRYEDLLID